MTDNDKYDRIKNIIIDNINTIVFVVVSVILIRFFVAELRWIPSGSMNPTLVKYDRIVVEKFSKYPNLFKERKFENTPKRGDVMIFYPPFVKLRTNTLSVLSRLTGIRCEDVAYIKRVVGLPGEKFEIKKTKSGAYRVFINDKALKEDYIVSEFDYPVCKDDMYCGPFIIPEGQYFMMGDNRGNSLDSRYWGTLPKERFIGRATFLFWPIKRIKTL